MSKLTDGSFWADTLSRAGRQALQAAIPVLAIVAGGSVDGLSLSDAVTAVVVAALFTVLKALVGLTSGPDAPLWVQAFERAVSAAAGVGLGLSIVTWADVAATDWAAVGTAALGAAALSVAQLFVDPPSKAGDFDLAA